MANEKSRLLDAVYMLLVVMGLFILGTLGYEEDHTPIGQEGFLMQETPKVLPFSPSLEMLHPHSSVVPATTSEELPQSTAKNIEDSEDVHAEDKSEEDVIVPAVVVEPQHQQLPPGYGKGRSMGARNHHGCPPRPQEGFVTWRSDNRVVRATLPHMVPSSCSPPLKCSVSTTVHRRIFLQDGDTLEILLQAPPDYHPPTDNPTANVPALEHPQDPRPFTPSETSSHTHIDMIQSSTQITPLDVSTITTTAAESFKTTTEELKKAPSMHQKQQQQSTTTTTTTTPRQHRIRQQKQQQKELNNRQLEQDKGRGPSMHGDDEEDDEDNLTVPQRKTSSQKSSIPSSLPLVNNHTHIFSRDNHHIEGANDSVSIKDNSIEPHPLTNRHKRNTLLGYARGGRNNLLRNKLLWSSTGLIVRNRQRQQQQQQHKKKQLQLRRKQQGWNEEKQRLRRDLKDEDEREEEEEEREEAELREEDEEEEAMEEKEERDETEELGLSRRQLQVTPDVNQTSLSPLTIWKVSVSEWASCSTREGGQVAESGPEGVVTLLPHILQPGTNYFIGRSSWSSSECFKLSVTVRSAECGEGSLCSGKGTCLANSTMEHFQCRCCDGYTGSHCEELDACIDGPCLNSGICIDIQEGHDGRTFQCLCPYGYRGRFCEQRTNHCESTPCQNGGTCEGNHSSYSCYCPPTWIGPQCTEPVVTQQKISPLHNDEEPSTSGGCSSNPCMHGVCVESPQHDFKCFCQPGYGGSRCEFEYNECESSPCQNGGTCVDNIGGYQCLCGRGYEGRHCQSKRNLCDPDPCPNSRVCVDKGNSYSCECLQGISDDDCEPHTQVCNPNPCENGGTCWNVAETHVFFCACRPGFTGNTCTSITQELPEDERLGLGLPEEVEGLGTVEPRPLDIQMPLSIQLHHMKNLYVAAATLAAALLIVAIVVGACHCRVNRTYRKCFVKMPRAKHMMHSVRRPRPSSLLEKASSLMSERSRERTGALRLESDPDGAAVPMTSSANSDTVYYNMDVCDNQELPLIK